MWLARTVWTLKNIRSDYVSECSGSCGHWVSNQLEFKEYLFAALACPRKRVLNPSCIVHDVGIKDWPSERWVTEQAACNRNFEVAAVGKTM